jgi:hypothetical protein
VKPLDVPLIPEVRQAFTLQFLTQALTFERVVRTSLALQFQLLREVLELSFKL